MSCKMEDEVPDELIFDIPKADESEKEEYAINLDDPPKGDSICFSNIYESEKHDYNDENIDNSNGELLELREPPVHIDNELNRITENIAEEEIWRFAEEFVDPIVKEAIELQKEQIEIDSSELSKIDSCGDKKSDKSSSSDGFEYVKADDIITNNEEYIEEDEKEFMAEGTTKYVDDEDRGVTEDEKEFVPEYEKEDAEEPNLCSLKIGDDFEENTNFFEENFVPYSTNEGLEFNLIEATEAKHEEISINPIETTEEPEIINKPLEEEHVPIFSESSFAKVDENFDGVAFKPEIVHRFKEVVHWTDPLDTGIVLSCIMLFELGMMSNFSFITLLAYFGIMVLLANFTCKLCITFKLCDSCPRICLLDTNADDVQFCVDYCLTWINYLIKEVRELAFVVSYTKNLKVFISFWLLTYIGQWFNLLSLVFVATLLIFSVPVLYSKYEREIDNTISVVRSDIRERVNRVKSKCQRIIYRK